MKKFAYTEKRSVLIAILLMLLTAACSKESQMKRDLSGSSQLSMELIIDPLPTKQVRGYYHDVSYMLEDSAKHKFAEGKLKCDASNVDQDSSEEVVCTSVALPAELSSGLYRILLKSDSGHGLICDIFSYKAGTSIKLVMNEETSGDCLLWQLMAETGYSESEVKTRTAHILKAEHLADFNLSATLFDLYMYYGGKDPHKKAWHNLVELIKSNKPFPKKDDSTANSGLHLR